MKQSELPGETEVTVSREKGWQTDQHNSVDCGVGEKRRVWRAENLWLHLRRTGRLERRWLLNRVLKEM